MTSAISWMNQSKAVAGSSDPYWSSVTLLLGNDNAANGSTTFTDQSNTARTMTAVGNIVYTNAQAAPGMTTSIVADGAGDYLTSPYTANLDFGTADFTVELYIRFNSSADQSFISRFKSGGYAWLFQYFNTGGVIRFYTGNNGSLSTAYTFGWGPPTANTWYHIAISRNGSNLKCFVDGTQTGTTQTLGAQVLSSTQQLAIDTNEDAGPGQYVNGWQNGIRVTTGVGRYTANFTKPSLPLPTATT